MNIFAPASEKRASLGLLLFRIVTGGALMMHGAAKIGHPFSWMPHSTVPGCLQFMSAFAELGGGLALVLGLLTPIFCLLLMVNMLVALFMVHIPHADVWVGHGHSYESALGYLAAATMLLLTGPGKFSLDHEVISARLEAACSRTPKRKTAWV